MTTVFKASHLANAKYPVSSKEDGRCTSTRFGHAKNAFVPNTVTYIVSAMLAGYAFGGLEPSLQSMAVHTSTDQTRGSANSTFLCGYDIGYGLGGGVAGSLITGLGYSAMWSIVSLACVVSVLVYVLWARHSDTSFTKMLRERA